MYAFPGTRSTVDKKTYQVGVTGGKPGYKILHTGKGYFNMEAFKRYYFELYFPTIQTIRADLKKTTDEPQGKGERPAVLLLDSYSGHMSYEVIMHARAHNIFIVTIPPHTSQLMQPVDNFLRGYKKAWYAAKEKYEKEHKAGVSKWTILDVIETFHDRHMRHDAAIKHSFSAPGIFPLPPPEQWDTIVKDEELFQVAGIVEQGYALEDVEREHLEESDSESESVGERGAGERASAGEASDSGSAGASDSDSDNPDSDSDSYRGSNRQRTYSRASAAMERTRSLANSAQSGGTAVGGSVAEAGPAGEAESKHDVPDAPASESADNAVDAAMAPGSGAGAPGSGAGVPASQPGVGAGVGEGAAPVELQAQAPPQQALQPLAVALKALLTTYKLLEPPTEAGAHPNHVKALKLLEIAASMDEKPKPDSVAKRKKRARVDKLVSEYATATEQGEEAQWTYLVDGFKAVTEANKDADTLKLALSLRGRHAPAASKELTSTNELFSMLVDKYPKVMATVDKLQNQTNRRRCFYKSGTVQCSTKTSHESQLCAVCRKKWAAAQRRLGRIPPFEPPAVPRE